MREKGIEGKGEGKTGIVCEREETLRHRERGRERKGPTRGRWRLPATAGVSARTNMLLVVVAGGYW